MAMKKYKFDIMPGLRDIDLSKIRVFDSGDNRYGTTRKYTRGKGKALKVGEFYIEGNDLYINPYPENSGRDLDMWLGGFSISWAKSSFHLYSTHINISKYYNRPKGFSDHVMWYSNYPTSFSGSYKKFLLKSDTFIQDEEDLEDLVKKHEPYLYKFLKEHKQNMLLGICFPKIEILYKAGYKLAKDIIDSGKDFNIKTARGLCNMKGTNPRSILRVPNYALPDLKDADLERCHFLRLVSQLHGISEKEYKWYAESGLTRKDLGYFNIKGDAFSQDHYLIMYFGNDLKTPYIWFTKCIEYLKKTAGEHISRIIHTIIDYKRMCNELGIKFDKSPEYLIQNHDMVAKLYRENQAKLMEEKRKREELGALEIINECKKYNFEDDEFFIRSVENRNDITDEASQQHNCVASYWSRVSRGETMIFFMRRKSNPEKSYVTVELTYDIRIQQAYLKGNQIITDIKTNNFLKTWKKFVIETKKKKEGN